MIQVKRFILLGTLNEFLEKEVFEGDFIDVKVDEEGYLLIYKKGGR